MRTNFSSLTRSTYLSYHIPRSPKVLTYFYYLVKLFFLWRSPSALFLETQAPVFNNDRFSKRSMDRQGIQFKRQEYNKVQTLLFEDCSPSMEGEYGSASQTLLNTRFTWGTFSKIPMSKSYSKWFNQNVGMGERYQERVKFMGDSNIIIAKFGIHKEDGYSVHLQSLKFLLRFFMGHWVPFLQKVLRQKTRHMFGKNITEGIPAL